MQASSRRSCLRLSTFAFVFTLALLAVHFAATTPAFATAADRLTQQEAELRRAQVAEVAYDLAFDLTGEERFRGTAVLSFRTLRGGEDLRVDYAGGTIERLELDGEPLAVPAEDEPWLMLPGARLPAGRHRLEVDFTHPYGNEGTGLHRFTDPEDGRTYLYTYLWPFYAHHLFPCFDQPDLRASYAVRVTAPADWQVVSNAAETMVRRAREGAREWHFPPTVPFSTYVFALHAGPWQTWEDRAGRVPLRLFARRSLAPFVDAARWLGVTREGLAIYEEYFGIPYPYGKYDQLLVPEFQIGGMENVAAVTYRDEYVLRRAPTSAELERVDNVNLHELSHMWFGDLATMEWWNGLWLNESFATYLAHVALARTGHGGWHGFFAGSKRGAYRADQRVTTHPIEVAVPDTDAFFDVYDAITYGKGASVLAQLSHLVGEDAFRAGVSTYLRRNAFSNTRLEDFTAAIAEAAGMDLGPWVRQWLMEAGVNTVEARWECAGDRLATLRLLQRAPEAHPTLRRHRLQVGLFASRPEGIVEIEAFPVTIEGAETVLPGNRLPCPDAVYPNLGDWGYVRVALDERSMATVRGGLTRFPDPHLRSQLLHGLIEEVTLGEGSPVALVEAALAALPAEADERVAELLLEAIGQGVGTLERLELPAARAALARLAPVVEQALWREASAAPAGGDRQAAAFAAYVASAQTAGGLDRLAALLRGAPPPAGLELDPDRRWDLVHTLQARGHAAAAALLAAERDRDRSERAEARALAVAVASPDLAVKRRWLATLHAGGGGHSLARQRAVMGALFPAAQSELQAALLPEVLGALGRLGDRHAYFLASYAPSLLPGDCSDRSAEAMRAALDTPGLHRTLRRFLAEAHEDEARCARMAATHFATP